MVKIFRYIMLTLLILVSLGLIAAMQTDEPSAGIGAIWFIVYIGNFWVASWEDEK